MKQRNKVFSEALDDARHLPKTFYTKAKVKNTILFIHSYPNLDNVLLGGDLIDRAEITEMYDSRLIIANVGPKVKPDTHVFLGLTRFKGVVMGYVYSVNNGIALIQGMGGEVQK